MSYNLDCCINLLGQPQNPSYHTYSWLAVLPRLALHIVIFIFERQLHTYIPYHSSDTNWTWPVWVWHITSGSHTLTRPYRRSLRMCRGWSLGRPFQVLACSYWQISTHKRLAWTWRWRVGGGLFSCELLTMMQLDGMYVRGGRHELNE